MIQPFIASYQEDGLQDDHLDWLASIQNNYQYPLKSTSLVSLYQDLEKSFASHERYDYPWRAASAERTNL
jgi:hypothetical protein